MSKPSLRGWRVAVPVLVAVVGLAVTASVSFAGAKAGVVRVAIMTDCKGAFGGAFEVDTGGALAALAEYAGGKPNNPKKPSAGTEKNPTPATNCGRGEADQERRLRVR